MWIANIIVGIGAMAYGAYVLGVDRSCFGFTLLLLGLANLVMGVALLCK